MQTRASTVISGPQPERICEGRTEKQLLWRRLSEVTAWTGSNGLHAHDEVNPRSDDILNRSEQGADVRSEDFGVGSSIRPWTNLDGIVSTQQLGRHLGQQGV